MCSIHHLHIIFSPFSGSQHGTATPQTSWGEGDQKPLVSWSMLSLGCNLHPMSGGVWKNGACDFLATLARIQPLKFRARGNKWWATDGETVETVPDFIFGAPKSLQMVTCSHEIKRCLLLGRQAMTNLDIISKGRDITLPTKVRLVKAMVFPVVMYGCESWTVKKAEC